MTSSIRTLPGAIPGDVILFADPHPKAPRRDGFNTVGIALPDGNIVFVRDGKAVEIGADQLERLPVSVMRPKVTGITDKIAAFFAQNRTKPRLVALGKAIECQNYGVFDSREIMPTLRAYRSEREHEAAWERLTNSLKPGDLVFTANRRNVVSRLIAWLDHGVWAHVATHIGDGRLVEALPEGVVERDISSYKDIKIHVGVYRDPNLERTGVQRLIETVRHKVGAGYDYRGALKLGFIKLLLRVIYGDRAFYVTVAGDPQLTPNDLIYSGRFALVDYL